MNTVALIKVLNVVALAAIMLAIGLGVRFDEVAASLRRMRLVVAGIAANFVLVPLVTVVLIHAFQPPPLVSAGFIILAVCPGAPMGPSFTSAAKGDVSVATGAMVVLAALSAVLAPTLLTIHFRWIVSSSELIFDYLGIIKILLVTQLLPLAIGLGLHEWLPKLAERVVRPLSVAANVLLLALVGLILKEQFGTLKEIRLGAWCGMLLLLVASLAIGWCCGGRDRGARRALSVTTGVRNAAVGLAIGTTNFAGSAAVTAVVAYAVVSIFGTLVLALVIGRGTSEQRPQ
jgi:bile acid:Na+ symporter, BASS family